MVQFQKEEIRQSYLAAARHEFMLHGFSGANMRAIAKRAGQNTSNIYNYFKNKDDLFRAVVSKTLKAIDQGVSWIKSWKPSADQPFYSIEEERQSFHLIIDFVLNNRKDIELLAFKSAGSSLENLLEELKAEGANVFHAILHDVAEFSKGMIPNVPSRFFMTTLLDFFSNGVLNMLRRGFNREEMHKRAEEMLVFYYYGIMALASGKS
jgi:AcrR family transcriptional regulator